MSEIKTKFRDFIREFVKDKYGVEHNPIISPSKDEKFGEYSVTSAFSLAKELRKIPLKLLLKSHRL